MPFIHTYNAAVQLLQSMGVRETNPKWRRSWIQNLRYAVKTDSNPLSLTTTERKKLTILIDEYAKDPYAAHFKHNKKSANRKAPPYHACMYQGQTRKGLDGNKYISVAKNKIFKWVLVV